MVVDVSGVAIPDLRIELHLTQGFQKVDKLHYRYLVEVNRSGQFSNYSAKS